jgi:hypothetical protein
VENLVREWSLETMGKEEREKKIEVKKRERQ